MDIISLIETVVPAQYTGEDINIDRAECVGVNRVRNYCRLCADICPRGAISFQKSTKIEIDHDSCSHCGACLTVCPVQAVQSNWLSTERFYARLAKSGTVLCCGPVVERLGKGDTSDQATFSVLDCLDRLDEAALLFLLNQADRQVDIVLADCSTCAVGCHFGMPELICEYVLTMLDALSIEATINIHRLDSDSQVAAKLTAADSALMHRASAQPSLRNAEALDRRAAFTELRKQAVGIFGKLASRAAPDLITPAQEKLTAKEQAAKPKRLPARSELARDSLLSLLKKSGLDSTAIANTELPNRLWGYPLVNSKKCVKCNVCSTLCPTAAITRVMEKGSPQGLDIRPYRCVQCGRCVQACAPEAIEVLQTLPVSLLLQRHTIAERFGPKVPATPNLSPFS